MPNTWRAVSKQVEGEVIPQTDINEHYISVMKVQQLLDRGYNAKEIALVWNGTLGGSEKPIVKKGRNKLGVAYDTLAYATLVTIAYAEQ